MAIVSGVNMNGLAECTIAGLPWSARRWLRIAPHDVAAGDQMTGRGPSLLSSHEVASRVMAAPDDLLCGRTKIQPPSTLADADPLNCLASEVIRSNFSGETAMSTVVQLPG